MILFYVLFLHLTTFGQLLLTFWELNGAVIFPLAFEISFWPILIAHHCLQQHSCSNCSTISNIDCCPQQCHTTTNTNNRNHKPSKCQLFDDIGMTIKEYHNGQKWLEQCQECECLVSERNP